MLSVEVLGGRQGEFCSLGKRCLFNVQVSSVDDVRDALAAAQPPLVAVAVAAADDGAAWIAIIGHSDSCWSTDDNVLCGYADLADSADGVLPIDVTCGGCPTQQIPFCP